MGWMKFSNYRKRFWDLKYKDNQIRLVFNHRRTSKTEDILVRWSAKKFRGCDFEFVEHQPLGEINWRKVFKKLKISLTYGLNQSSRAVTDRMLKVDKGGPHPIHRVNRTSKQI